MASSAEITLKKLHFIIELKTMRRDELAQILGSKEYPGVNGKIITLFVEGGMTIKKCDGFAVDDDGEVIMRLFDMDEDVEPFFYRKSQLIDYKIS